MDESIEICVEHNRTNKMLPRNIFTIWLFLPDYHYYPRHEYNFEPDEERQWRARFENNTPMNKDVQELLPLIAAELHENLQ
jgi:hypothetical protein